MMGTVDEIGCIDRVLIRWVDRGLIGCVDMMY